MWIVYSLLSAAFAAAVSILTKIGLKDVDSNLATAIRTAAVLVISWGIVFFTGKHKGISDISGKSLLFLIASGAATGLSWLCYFKALQMADASKVAPIDKLSMVFTVILAFFILGEKLGAKTVIGVILIAAGTLFMIL